ncbi:MAG: hypothetical protein WKF64_10350, partial [Ilumatobacteraceae bacterium]
DGRIVKSSIASFRDEPAIRHVGASRRLDGRIVNGHLETACPDVDRLPVADHGWCADRDAVHRDWDSSCQLSESHLARSVDVNERCVRLDQWIIDAQ